MLSIRDSYLLGLLVWFILQPTVWTQDIGSLPPCAGRCANLAAFAAGCSVTDIPCLCKTTSFRSATLQCAAQTCPVEDRSLAAGILDEMCNSLPASSSASTSGSSSSTTSKPVVPRPPITTNNPPSVSRTTGTPATTPDPSDGATSQIPPATSSSPSIVTSFVTTGVPVTITAPPTSPAAASTTVVFSTSTSGLGPTSNAAFGLTGQHFGSFGAIVVGLLAFM